MTPEQALAIRESLHGANPATLAAIAEKAMGDCLDGDCRNVVLKGALMRANDFVATQVAGHFGEGKRLALGVGTGARTGLLRGLGGDFWGRLFTLVPAISGLAIGLASKDPSTKAAGMTILSHTSATEAGIETFNGGTVLRAHMMAPNPPPPKVPPVNPAPGGSGQ